MNDYLIRRCLKQKLTTHFNDDPSIIVSEFDLCQGIVRADIVVVNGHLHGYEIKSDEDTLTRLPMQIGIYSKVLDFVTIVTCKKHLTRIREAVPPWWGIMLADSDDDLLTITQLRKPKQNRNIDKYSLAQLLWREEALFILSEHGMEKGLKTKPRKVLWSALAQYFEHDALNDFVRSSIKQRTDWRADAIRTPSDEWQVPQT